MCLVESSEYPVLVGCTIWHHPKFTRDATENSQRTSKKRKAAWWST
jgi:hypothetical protein